MTMNEPVNRCLAVDCEAYLPLLVDATTAKALVAWFRKSKSARNNHSSKEP